MSALDTQTKRREAFAKLIEQYGQRPDDYDEGEEEDPRPYLSGELSLDPWIVVTANYSSHGERKVFFLPEFSRHAAQQRAVYYADDDIFEELPVEVVNLDTGEVWVPRWGSLQWRTEHGYEF